MKAQYVRVVACIGAHCDGSGRVAYAQFVTRADVWRLLFAPVVLQWSD